MQMMIPLTCYSLKNRLFCFTTVRYLVQRNTNSTHANVLYYYSFLVFSFHSNALFPKTYFKRFFWCRQVSFVWKSVSQSLFRGPKNKPCIAVSCRSGQHCKKSYWNSPFAFFCLDIFQDSSCILTLVFYHILIYCFVFDKLFLNKFCHSTFVLL